MNIGDTVQTINTLCPISGTVVEIYDNLIVISDDDAETDDDILEFHVDDYVNNLTPDQLREIVHEQSHIDFENIRQDTGQESVFEEMASWDSELYTDIAIEFDLEEAE